MKEAIGTLLAALALQACFGPSPESKMPYERHLALKELEGSGDLREEAVKALEDPDWRVAATACTLAVKHDLDLGDAIARALGTRSFGDGRLEYMIYALGMLRAKRHARLVRSYLKHGRAAVRHEALSALRPDRLGSRAATRWILPLTRDANRQVRDQAINVLSRYQTREAVISVALIGRDIAGLARVGATQEILAMIKQAPPAGRRAILRTVTQVKRSNPALMERILVDASLVELHRAAFMELRRRGARAIVARWTQKLLGQWVIKIDKELEGCGGADWYPSFTRIRTWHLRPRFAFLKPRLKSALQLCRKAAIGVVGRESAQMVEKKRRGR